MHNQTPKISVAPMMDWTDRHCRYFHRALSKNIWLYTEMITDQALIHGDPERLLKYDPFEHPVALQLGGSNPENLYKAVKITLAHEFKYDEINLNIGCPSDRVQSGAFGLCLMKDPERVVDCLNAMAQAISDQKSDQKLKKHIPITAKTRTGVDDLDSYEYLHNFINLIKTKTPCREFIIHARKGWLSGLSPKENREIPPLDYSRVYQLKKDFPECVIIMNGGVKNILDITNHLDFTDGIMIGRTAYHQPYLLAELDQEFFKNNKKISRLEIIKNMQNYIAQELDQGTRLHSITRHMLGLYHGQAHSKFFKKSLGELGINSKNIKNNKQIINLLLEIFEQAEEV